MMGAYHKSANCWWFSLNAFLGTCWDRTVGYTVNTHRCTTKQLQNLSLLLFHYCKQIIQGDHWGLTVAVRGHLSQPGLPAVGKRLKHGNGMGHEKWNGWYSNPSRSIKVEESMSFTCLKRSNKVFLKNWVAQSCEPHYSKFRRTHKAEAAVDPACLLHGGRLDLRI